MDFSPHLNSSGFALVGAIVAILLRKREIGGWLFYFFWQVLLALALIATTTQWRLYRASEWGDPGQYFLYLVANLPRVLFLWVVGLVWVRMVLARNWNWVCAMRYTLATYGFLTLLKTAVDLAYLPANVPLDILSLAFPVIWIVYFGVSRRVRIVFRDSLKIANQT